MIMGSFGAIRTISAHDHENGPAAPHPGVQSVSDAETTASSAERMWQTVTVTSGRIIIGWRVGT
jgi:hypothetical protein